MLQSVLRYLKEEGASHWPLPPALDQNATGFHRRKVALRMPLLGVKLNRYSYHRGETEDLTAM